MRLVFLFLILFSLLTRILVSLILLNGNLILPPSDSTDFHNLASELSKNFSWDSFTIGWIYSYWLSIFYVLLDDSRILGLVLSCLIWLVSVIYFKKVCLLIGFNNKQVLFYLFLYCFLPSSVFYASDTLREPYQMLFTILIVYFGIKYLRVRKSVDYIKLCLSLFCLSLLHHVFIIFAFFIFFYLAVTKFSLKKTVFMSFLFSGLLITFGSLFNSYFNDSSNLVDNIEKFNEIGRSFEANSTYPILYSSSNTSVSYFISFLFSFLQYLLEPFPWRIKNGMDVVVFVENILRYILLFNVFKILIDFKKRKAIDIDLSFLIFCFFVIEILWSMGTNNWGTAIRHHLPAVGISFLILGKIKTLNQ